MLFDRVMNLNVKSLWFISQAVAPHMIERKSGIIINVSSIAARNGGGIGADYLRGGERRRLHHHQRNGQGIRAERVRVNAVSPGAVDNDFHVAIFH